METNEAHPVELLELESSQRVMLRRERNIDGRVLPYKAISFLKPRNESPRVNSHCFAAQLPYHVMGQSFVGF